MKNSVIDSQWFNKTLTFFIWWERKVTLSLKYQIKNIEIMSTLKFTTTLLLVSCFAFLCVVKGHDYWYRIQLDKYYAHRAQLEKKGYDWKEANHIAMVEGGWIEADAHYTKLINRNKK